MCKCSWVYVFYQKKKQQQQIIQFNNANRMFRSLLLTIYDIAFSAPPLIVFFIMCSFKRGWWGIAHIFELMQRAAVYLTSQNILKIYKNVSYWVSFCVLEAHNFFSLRVLNFYSINHFHSIRNKRIHTHKYIVLQTVY